MPAAPRPAVLRQSGEIRWWLPIALLAGATVALVFAAWIGGVDMQAAGGRMRDRLDEFFGHNQWILHDERGQLEIQFHADGSVRHVKHDRRLLPPEAVLLEDGYLTVTTLTFEDGELMYWRVPMDWELELRESCRNPRWRLQLRVHPQPEELPAGLRCARLDPDGPAGRAGLRVGDVITAVDGQQRATSAALEEVLQVRLANLVRGGTLALTLRRDDATREVSLPLEPLVTDEEWERVPAEITDPVERYVLSQMPWKLRSMERDARAEPAPVADPPEPVAPEPPAGG